MKIIKLVLVLITLCIITILYNFNKNKSNMDSIRISFKNYYSIKEVDPADIKSIYQSNLIENLYSRLVEFDENNLIKCTLCKNFEIKDNQIIFNIRDDLKTKSGIVITAEDIIFSYKRLLTLNSNTHGNLMLFIDSENDIFSRDNKVIIKLKNMNFAQFVLPLLASMDFSVIPKTSIINNKIVDYINTSGPYFIEKDDELGYLVLNANPNHIYYSSEMFKTINIIPPEKGDPISDYLENKVDLLDITFYPTQEKLAALIKGQKKDFIINKTIPTRVTILNTSKNARDTFTKQQLNYICNKISNAYLKENFIIYGSTRTDEFFQTATNGHIEESQLNEIKKIHRTSFKDKEFPRKIIFGASKNVFNIYKDLLSDIQEIEVKSFDLDPAYLTEDQRPDLFIQTTDSSFNEDISLLSYNFSMGYFGKSKLDGEKWIRNFINENNQEKRIELLKNLQLELLENVIIYPISISSYWVISNPNFIPVLPNSFPGSLWWKLRKK